MKLGHVLSVIVAAGLVTGCSTFRGSSVSGEWSCRALGNSTCADIASSPATTANAHIVFTSAASVFLWSHATPILYGFPQPPA